MDRRRPGQRSGLAGKQRVMNVLPIEEGRGSFFLIIAIDERSAGLVVSAGLLECWRNSPTRLDGW